MKSQLRLRLSYHTIQYEYLGVVCLSQRGSTPWAYGKATIYTCFLAVKELHFLFHHLSGSLSNSFWVLPEILLTRPLSFSRLIVYHLDTGSNTSAHVLLNLINELRKMVKGFENTSLLSLHGDLNIELILSFGFV